MRARDINYFVVGCLFARQTKASLSSSDTSSWEFSCSLVLARANCSNKTKGTSEADTNSLGRISVIDIPTKRIKVCSAMPRALLLLETILILGLAAFGGGGHQPQGFPALTSTSNHAPSSYENRTRFSASVFRRKNSHYNFTTSQKRIPPYEVSRSSTHMDDCVRPKAGIEPLPRKLTIHLPSETPKETCLRIASFRVVNSLWQQLLRFVQALEDAEEVRRQALAKEAHQREQELAEERERRDKLARADARNREEERVRKAEEHRLQVSARSQGEKLSGMAVVVERCRERQKGIASTTIGNLGRCLRSVLGSTEPRLRAVARACVVRDLLRVQARRCAVSAQLILYALFRLARRFALCQTQRILEDQQFKMQKRMDEMKQQEAERQRKVRVCPGDRFRSRFSCCRHSGSDDDDQVLRSSTSS